MSVPTWKRFDSALRICSARAKGWRQDDVHLVMSNATQLGPFGHTLRTIALASNDPSDIRRWNDYAIALAKKLDESARARKAGISASEWFYSTSFHGAR